MNKQTNPSEWISALHDDALHAWPHDQVLDEATVQQWQETVRVSQATRGEAWADAASQQRVLAAVRAAYGAPVEANSPSLSPSAIPSNAPSPEATNDRVWAWPWAAALVLAVGAWMAWPQLGPQSAVMAKADLPTATTSVAQADKTWVEQNGVIRDPRLDALLQSHRQFGSSSALQYPAGFVRSVALER